METSDNAARHHRVTFRQVAMGLAVAVVLAGSASRADAQVSGYAIAGPAAYSGFFGSSLSALHGAAGGQYVFGACLGVGGEYGILGNSGGGLLVYSVNGVCQLPGLGADKGVAPFVTAGYSNFSSGEGTFHAWNLAGGTDVWIARRVGVRVEVRDHLRPDSRGDVHYWAFRGGIVIR